MLTKFRLVNIYLSLNTFTAQLKLNHTKLIKQVKTKRSKRLNDLTKEIEKTIFKVNQEVKKLEKNLKTNSFN